MRVTLFLILLSATPLVFASSSDKWEALRLDIETACRALVADPGAVAIEVNPFGSDSYGVALVTLTGEAGTDRMVCVYDKQTGKAELTAPFAAEPASDQA
jgi:hypothetical protein